MVTLIEMARSLGCYIQLKQQNGASRADFDAATDYHDFLRDVEPQAKLFAGNYFTPLDDITLTQLQYGDVVSQIFKGVPFMCLSIPLPPPEPVEVPQRERKYFESYLETLENDTRTRGDVETTYERMSAILSDREAEEQRVSGLVVGRVQSGKTRNYVGLILKAVDEGWNVVIVLTSANTALVEQTKTRLREDFERAKVYSQVEVAFPHAANARNNNPAPMQLLDQHNTAFYWAVAMKQTHSLQGLLGWLRENGTCVPRMRILVIDDEADNATPDSNVGRNNQMSASEMDELVAVIRDEDLHEHDYSALADWLEGLQDAIEEKIDGIPEEILELIEHPRQDEPINWNDVPDNLRDVGQTMEKLERELEKGGSATLKFRAILDNRLFREFLGLQEIVQDGQVFNLRQDAESFFGVGKGHRTFIKLLNTVFAVAVSRSAINRHICELIDRVPGTTQYSFPFQKCAYVAYTATPYANILNERPDQTPLYADFIKPLSTPPQYFGLDKIFGRDYRKDPPIPANMNVVDEIRADDKRFALNPIQGIKDSDIKPKRLLNVTIGTDLRYECHDPETEGSWDSLTRALAWAFCTAGARRRFFREVYTPRVLADASLSEEKKKKKLAKVDYRWTTMLMNISQKQETHDLLRGHVADYLRERCGNLDAREKFLAECKGTWDLFTRSYTKEDFERAFNRGEGDDYGAIGDYPAWEAIQEDVRYFIDGWHDTRVHPIVINAAHTANRDTYNNGSLDGCHLWIVIGGNTIGRGLTLAGLTTSYFDRVRKSVAVDTLTQMGRWFGYRKDYELLPRLWMTPETVQELKKTAFVEEAMHESMRESFDAGHSPSDPEHYQKIYSWGRKLSGRARAQTRWMKSAGTMTTTMQLSVRRDDMEAIHGLVRQFILGLGDQTYRDSSISAIHRHFPLWTKVDRNAIRAYLESILPHQADGMQQTFRALIKEIDATEDNDPAARWDVVIGEPTIHRGRRYDIGVGEIFSGNPTAKVSGGEARYSSVRQDLAFYAMIPTNVINQTNAEMVEQGSPDVVERLKVKLAKDNGVVRQALAPYPGATVEDQLRALVAHVKAHPETEVPACIRDCLPEGVRNLSAIEYREMVYANAGHRRPILQFYLLTPPAEAETQDVPLIAHAVYWPDHKSDDFDLMCAGMDVVRKPEKREICAVAERILKENGFPMSVQRLRERVQAEFPDFDAGYLNTNIPNPPSSIRYAQFPGKDAYYHLDWSLTPEEDVRDFILDRASEILADGQEHERRELAQRIFADLTKLEGLFDPGNGAELKTIFAPENLAGRGIAQTCKRPVKFQLRP